MRMTTRRTMLMGAILPSEEDPNTGLKGPLAVGGIRIPAPAGFGVAGFAARYRACTVVPRGRNDDAGAENTWLVVCSERRDGDA